MRSSQITLDQYDSDKIDNHYLEQYDPALEHLVNENIVLLELGVLNGGSLLLWSDYFPQGKIVGIDIKLPKKFQPTERIHIFEGSQTDTNFLSDVADKTAPDGYDVIIDDASHVGQLTKTAFWHLFDNHLKPGGLYIIEDWGTGYWDERSDGKSLNLEAYLESESRSNIFSRLWKKVKRKLGLKTAMIGHNYGMVGFVKQLVDEQGARDVTREKIKGNPLRNSKFEKMTISHGLVLINKACTNK